jgi:hypothetical protein
MTTAARQPERIAMISNPVVRKVVQFEYTLVRTPLVVLDRRLLAHVPAASMIRTSLERGIDTLDAAAGRLLRPRTDSRGATSRPSSAPPPAPTEPSAPVEETVDTEAAFEAADRTVEVPLDEVEQVAEQLLARSDTTPPVGELADPDLQEVQAELRAKHLLEEQEEEKRLAREHAERVKAADAAKDRPAAEKTAAEKTAAEKTAALKAPAKNGAPRKRTPPGR